LCMAGLVQVSCRSSASADASLRAGPHRSRSTARSSLRLAERDGWDVNRRS
jgi:hypothetical protein